MGSGSPFGEDDESITHFVIDRPLVQRADETAEEQERRRRRKYVQPQWVADCVNAGKILLEDPYAQGKTLPPHLSPFEEYTVAPDAAAKADEVMNGAEASEEESEEDVHESGSDAEMREDRGEQEGQEEENAARAVAKAAISEDLGALRAAELAAEAAGMDYTEFEKEVKKSKKRMQKVSIKDDAEGEMNKMMMSNRQRKLYEKMKYSEKKKETEVSVSWEVGCLSLSDVFFLLTACEIGHEARTVDEGEEKGGQEEGATMSFAVSLAFLLFG